MSNYNMEYGVPMNDPLAIQYERTNGYESPDTRMRKIQTRICIAGVGGGGALLAEAAAKEGYGDIRVADPDLISPSNMNRLFVANAETIGRNKAEVIAERIHLANPAAHVEFFEDGVTANNVDDFFMAGLRKDQRVIGVDEIDIQRPDVALGFSQTARKYGVPVTTGVDIGTGGIVTSYNPNARRYTFEHVNHTPNDMRPFVKYDGDLSLSTLAYIPTYGSIDTLMSVMKGAETPSQLRSVLIATAMILREMDLITMEGAKGFPRPTWAPRQRWLDANGASGSTYFPRVSHYSHLARAVLRDKVFSINPPANYRLEDIKLRAEYRKAHGEQE